MLCILTYQWICPIDHRHLCLLLTCMNNTTFRPRCCSVSPNRSSIGSKRVQALPWHYPNFVIFGPAKPPAQKSGNFSMAYTLIHACYFKNGQNLCTRPCCDKHVILTILRCHFTESQGRFPQIFDATFICGAPLDTHVIQIHVPEL